MAGSTATTKTYQKRSLTEEELWDYEDEFEFEDALGGLELEEGDA